MREVCLYLCVAQVFISQRCGYIPICKSVTTAVWPNNFDEAIVDTM